MTQTLKAGDRGALGALLQLALERAGQMPGALDGIFGAQTAAAVRAFQAANALVPDGIAGAQTLEKRYTLSDMTPRPDVDVTAAPGDFLDLPG